MAARIDESVTFAKTPQYRKCPENGRAPGSDEHLLNGPQMPDKAKRQADIDAILASVS